MRGRRMADAVGSPQTSTLPAGSPQPCRGRCTTPSPGKERRKNTWKQYLAALTVGKLASIVAGPLGWYLDDADRAIAAVDLGRAERGLPALSQLVLSNAYDIAAQALQFAADDAKRAARELERGKANSAAETEPKRAADYARNLAAGNPASE